MNPKFNILIILLFASACLSAQIAEKSIILETETGNIEGTLLMPQNKNTFPVVLIIAGSGPTDRDGNNPMMKNNSLKMLAEGLLEHGIASVRYDKRGVGESKDSSPEESKMRFGDYVEDAKAWIDLLEKNSAFSKTIVLGHSEGSLIGMIASQKEKVDKFISVAGIAEPAAKSIKQQLSAQPAFVLEQSLPILEKLEMGQKVDSVPPLLYSLFRPSVQPYLMSWFKYDPQQEMAKLDKPILILQGTADIQVDVSNAEKLAASNPRSEKRVIEGMNHILKETVADRMQNIQTYSMPDLPLKSGLIDAIVDFIKQR